MFSVSLDVHVFVSYLGLQSYLFVMYDSGCSFVLYFKLLFHVRRDSTVWWFQETQNTEHVPWLHLTVEDFLYSRATLSLVNVMFLFPAIFPH